MEKRKVTKKALKAINIDDLILLIVDLIQDKKGNHILSLDMRHISEAMTDFFVICHATSTTQVRAILDHLEEEVKKQTNIKPYHLEGRANSEWCLIDFGDVIVHIFQEEKRAFYQLEELWSDAIIKLHE